MMKKINASQYNFLLHKRYFDTGWSLTNYFKYLILLGGIYEGFSTQDMNITLIIAVVYMLSCYFIGKLWVKYGWMEADIEVTNTFNMFVKEVREWKKKSKLQ